MKDISIRIKLIGGFMVVLLLVCTGLGYIAYDRASQTVQGQIQTNLPLMAEDGAMLVEDRLNHHLTVVEGIANRDAIRSMDWEQQKRVLEQETERLGYLGMGIIDTDGEARYPDGDTASLGDRDYFQEAMDGKTVISEMIISRVIEKPVFILASPIKDDRGEVASVLLVRADGLIMLSEITDQLGYGETGYSFMIDGEGAVIAHDNRDLIMEQRNFIEEARTDDTYSELAAVLTDMTEGRTGFDEYPFMGTVRVQGYTSIEGTDWAIAVGGMRDDIFAPVYELRWAMVIASLLFLGVSMAIGFAISRSITSPMSRLTQYAEKVAAGNMEAESGIDRKDEMGRLAQSISSMTENLKERSYWYESMLDAIPFPVSVTDTEMHWTFINKAAMEVTGKRREEILGKHCRNWGADICGTDRCGIECLKRGQSTSWFTQPGLEKDFQVDAAYLTDRTGAYTGHIEVVQDVTEGNRLKRQAEQALKDGVHQAAESIESVVERMTSASEQLAAQVEQASRGTDEQTNRISETATSMEEMNATVLEVARNASGAAEQTDSAKAKAEEGAGVVKQSVDAINEVQEQSKAMKENLASLGKQSEEIGKVMTVIDDIADQTNLLALNAAIEAARAGDAGRGFAVVADEVRKLAEKTMNATKEVEKTVTSIQESTKSNMDSMDQSVQAVEKATELANSSGQALQEIVNLAQEAADQVRSIATASEEQSSASEEVNKSMEDVNRIAGETADAMNQSAQAVSDLAQQASELKKIIEDLNKT